MDVEQYNGVAMPKSDDGVYRRRGQSVVQDISFLRRKQTGKEDNELVLQPPGYQVADTMSVRSITKEFLLQGMLG